MGLFGKKLGIEEIKKRMQAFEGELKTAEEERKGLREKLTAALATGSDMGPLQRRAAELDALIAAAPEARRLLQVELDRAKAIDARPRLETILAKIERFKESLAAAETAVSETWSELTAAIDELKELELPPSWGPALKIAFSKEGDAVLPGWKDPAAMEAQLQAERDRRAVAIESQVPDPRLRAETIGKLDAEIESRRRSLRRQIESERPERAGRRTPAQSALDGFREALLVYCTEWETPLRGCLAASDEPLEKPAPPDSIELAEQHRRIIRGK